MRFFIYSKEQAQRSESFNGSISAVDTPHGTVQYSEQNSTGESNYPDAQIIAQFKDSESPVTRIIITNPQVHANQIKIQEIYTHDNCHDDWAGTTSRTRSDIGASTIATASGTRTYANAAPAGKLEARSSHTNSNNTTGSNSVIDNGVHDMMHDTFQDWGTPKRNMPNVATYKMMAKLAR